MTPEIPKDPCEMLQGPAEKYCEYDEKPGGDAPGPGGATSPTDALAGFTADLYRHMHDTMTGRWDIDLNAGFMAAYQAVLWLGLVIGLFTWLAMTFPVAIGRDRAALTLARSTGTLVFFAGAGAFAPIIFWIVFGSFADVIAALGTPEGASFEDMAKRAEDQKHGPASFLGMLASSLCLGFMWLLSMLRGIIVILGAICSPLVAATLVKGRLSQTFRLWARSMIVLLASPAVISLALLLGLVLPDDPIFDVLVLIVVAGCLVGLFAMLPVIGSTIKAGFGPDSRVTATLEATDNLVRHREQRVREIKSRISHHRRRREAPHEYTAG